MRPQFSYDNLIIGDTMKKKGFTLVELLAIIAILAIIITISMFAYNKIQAKIVAQQLENDITYILTAAEDYAHQNGFTVDKTVTVDYLVKRGLITADDDNDQIINPQTKKKMNCLEINIHYDNTNQSYEAKFTNPNKLDCD